MMKLKINISMSCLLTSDVVCHYCTGELPVNALCQIEKVCLGILMPLHPASA